MINDLHRKFESAFGIPLAVVPMPDDLSQIFPGRLLWGSTLAQQWGGAVFAAACSRDHFYQERNFDAYLEDED